MRTYIRDALLTVAVLAAVVLGGEECHPVNLRNRITLQRCLTLTKQKAMKLVPSLITEGDDLPVYMHMIQRQEQMITPKLCCQRSFVYPKGDFTVNLLSESKPTLFLTKALASEVTYHSLDAEMYIGDSNLYTMLFINSRIGPGSAADKPYLHGMLTNIQGLDLTTSNVNFLYSGPLEDGPYLYMLYKQSERIDAINDGDYNDDSIDCKDGRAWCMFDVAQLVADKNLRLVSINGYNRLWPDQTFYAYVYQQMGMEVEGCRESYPEVVENNEIVCPEDFCSIQSVRNPVKLPLCLEAARDRLSDVTDYVPSESNLSIFLDVRWTQTTLIENNLCCNNYMFPGGEVRLDPVVGTPVDSYITRSVPHIEFLSNDPDIFEDSNYYTMATFAVSGDVPEFIPSKGTASESFNLYMRFNIRGLDICTSGEVLNPYSPAYVSGVYVIMLFKQDSGAIAVEEGDYNSVDGGCPVGTFCRFQLSRMISEKSLTLVGATWYEGIGSAPFLARSLIAMGTSELDACTQIGLDVELGDDGNLMCPGDVCSASNVMDISSLSACLDAMSSAAQPLTLHISRSDKLKVYMDITWHTPDVQLDSFCCTKFFFEGGDFRANPLNMMNFSSHQLQMEPDVDFFSIDKSIYLGDDNLYTIGMFDISGDEPDMGMASPEEPWVHWMVINVPGLDISQGEVINPFFRLLMSAPHVFMLYKQTTGRISIDLEQYDTPRSECFNTVLCKFQLRRMVQEQRLKLIGINWMMVEKNQRYVQWSYVEMGVFNMAQTCFDDSSINEKAIECPGEECDPVYFRNQDTLPMCLASVTKAGRELTEHIDEDLTLYMDVIFNEPALDDDEFCCRGLHYPAVQTRLNPLSPMNYTVWMTRSLPDIQMYPTKNSEIEIGYDNYYTFVMFDIFEDKPNITRASPEKLHWLKTNVQELDYQFSGDTHVEFQGTALPGSYVFMVYKQELGRIDVADGDYNGQREACFPGFWCLFDVKRFVSDKSLKLIGSSWMITQGDNKFLALILELEQDPMTCEMAFGDTMSLFTNDEGQIECPDVGGICSEDAVRVPAFLPDCLHQTRKELSKHTMFVDEKSMLYVWMEIDYNVPPRVVTNVCCEDLELEQARVRLNPAAQTNYSLHLLEQPETIKFFSACPDLYEGDSNLYTIVMVEVSGDGPDMVLASPSEPWLHWMVTNIKGMDMNTGDVVHTFFGAIYDSPYVFLMLRQKRGPIHIRKGEYSTLEHCPPSAGCNFRMSEFIRSEDLEIVGATMFMGDLGDKGPGFTAYRFLQFATPEVNVCEHFFPGTEIRSGRVFCPQDADLNEEARNEVSTASLVNAGPWMLITMLANVLYCTM